MNNIKSIRAELPIESINAILRFIQDHLSEVRKDEEEDLLKYLKSLFAAYIDEISGFPDIELVADKSGHKLTCLVHDVIIHITGALKAYLDGRIADAANKIAHLMKEDSPIPMQVVQWVKKGYKRPGKKKNTGGGIGRTDQIFYKLRIRKPGDKLYKKSEMSYVPFEKRYLTKSCRFSILGYPCLYVASSILCGWCEMGEPALENFAASSVEPNRKKSLDILNLTLPTMNDSRWRYEFLAFIPLIMACSIKVKRPEESFIPEYIIPQLVMLAIKSNGKVKIVDGKDTVLMGCMYTSTKRNEKLEGNEQQWYNIALPAKVGEGNEVLGNLIHTSDPTCYSYSLLQGQRPDTGNPFEMMQNVLYMNEHPEQGHSSSIDTP